MDPVKDYEDVLNSIETAVIKLWHTQPEMTNYTVMRAYEAAIAHYVAIARQQTPKPASLSGVDATLFEAVKDVCDWQLGLVQYADRPHPPPVPSEDMVACLRRLRKSVNLWTEQGGRKGYMEYIEKFLE